MLRVPGFSALHSQLERALRRALPSQLLLLTHVPSVQRTIVSGPFFLHLLQDMANRLLVLDLSGKKQHTVEKADALPHHCLLFSSIPDLIGWGRLTFKAGGEKRRGEKRKHSCRKRVERGVYGNQVKLVV